MADVDFKLLKELREKLGVSFSLIKKALEESKNDAKKAEKLLSEWGAKKAADKADRETGFGGIFSYVHHNKKVATLLELRSETDFVSGNDEFRKLGQELAMQLAAYKGSEIENFMKEVYIRDSSKTVADLIKDAVLKFGENLKIARINRWEMGQ